MYIYIFSIRTKFCSADEWFNNFRNVFVLLKIIIIRATKKILNAELIAPRYTAVSPAITYLRVKAFRTKATFNSAPAQSAFAVPFRNVHAPDGCDVYDVNYAVPRRYGGTHSRRTYNIIFAFSLCSRKIFETR